MNASKLLAISAAVAAVVGAGSFSYAQNINYKSPTNTTQTQSDAAVPCQPAPFNPHLPQSARAGSASGSTDCATGTAARVQVQTAVAVEPAPYIPPVQNTQPEVVTRVSTPEPAPVYQAAANNVRTAQDEPAPRADRN